MKAKKKNTKHGELWIKIRDFIKLIIKNSDDYDEKCMKIKFNSNEELTLSKTIKIPTMTIIVKAVFLWKWKYYPQVFFRWMSIWNTSIKN